MTKETEESQVGDRNQTVRANLDAGPSDMNRAIKIGLAAIVYAAALFVMIWFENVADSGLSLGSETILILASSFAIVIVTVLWLKALGLSGKSDEPIAASTKKNRRIIILCAIFGGVWATLFFASFALSDVDLSNASLFSNAPLPPVLAIGSAAILLTGLVYASLEWHKACDEHERAAINAGLYASFFFYSAVAPAWWMAQRSMLFPAQDPMIMYAMVLIIFSAVWTYKRGA